jgi:hypothetical protein
MRIHLTVIITAGLVFPADHVEARDDDRTADYTRQVDVTAGRFEGSYGLEESTTIDLVSTSLRWLLPRGEVQITVPYVSLQGPGDIRLIGGQPVPGFGGIRDLLPGPPPGGGPGGGEEQTIVEQRRESGLGDISLQAEYYLSQGSATRPWIIGLARVKTPTGDDAKGLGTGKTDLEAGLGLVQPFSGVNLLADVGYTRIGRSDSATLRDVLRLGAGVSTSFGPSMQHHASLYFETRNNAIRALEDQRTLSAGLGTQVGADRRVRLSGSVFAGLSDSVEDYGVFVRAGYRF